MARGASSNRRIELNRSLIDALVLAEGDGLYNAALAAVRQAPVPDAPPYGRGLFEGGGAIAFVNGKRIADSRIGGRTIRIPRGVRVSKLGVVAAGGFGFPARLVEFGTLSQRPQPFLTPTLLAEYPNAAIAVGEAVRARLANRPAPGAVAAARQARKATQLARVTVALGRRAPG